jgi:hypothetical protein
MMRWLLQQKNTIIMHQIVKKKQHKIDMINHGFEDSGQVVKKLRDISFLPSDWIHDSYVYYGCYIKQETMRKEKISTNPY